MLLFSVLTYSSIKLCEKLLEKTFIWQNCTLIFSKLKTTKLFLLVYQNKYLFPTKKKDQKNFHLQNKNLAVI